MAVELNQLLGTSGDDALSGTVEGDMIDALEGNDTVHAGDGDDYVEGNSGNDFLYGDAGDDDLIGGTGNDWFFAELGSDNYDGGLGEDGLDLSLSASAVSIDTTTGLVTDSFGVSNTVTDVEVFNGSAFDDIFIGKDTDNNAPIELNAAIAATGNYELFIGKQGADYIDGKGGYDEISLASATEGLTIDLAQSTVQDGLGGTDTILNIEGVEGTNFNDIIYGTSGANSLDGRLGNNVIDGKAGYDFVEYNGHARTNLQLDLAAGVATFSHNGVDYTDTLLNIEGVVGSHNNDVITGDSSANKIYGLTGDDQLFGGGGDDTYTVYLGWGHETISDTSGNDTLRVDLTGSTGSAWSFKRVGDDLVYTTNDVETVGYTIVDQFAGQAIENYELIVLDNPTWTRIDWVLNSGAELLGQNEILALTDQDDIFNFVGTGLKEVYGNAGDDIIDLGQAMPWLYAGAGNDSISIRKHGFVDGSSGVDTLNFTTNSQTGVTLVMGADSFVRQGVSGGEFAIEHETGNASFSGVENVKGGSGDDYLHGGDGNNTISGRLGNDSLHGGAGNDIIWGGKGNDTLAGNDGADWIGAGAGDDYIISLVDNWHGDHIKMGGVNDTFLFQTESATGIAQADISYVQITDGQNSFSMTQTADNPIVNTPTTQGIQYAFTITQAGIADVVFTVESDSVITEITATNLAADGDGHVNTELSFSMTSAISGSGHIQGTEGTDLIIGSDANDHIDAGAGDDVIESRGGNDYIDPGAGDDVIHLFSHNAGDAELGEAGGSVYMGAGNDVLDFDHGGWAWVHYSRANSTETEGALLNFSNAAHTFNGGQADEVVLQAYTAKDGYGDNDTYLNLGTGNNDGAHFWGTKFDDQLVTDKHVWWEATAGNDSVEFDATAGGWLAVHWDSQGVNWDLNTSTLEHKFEGEGAGDAAHTISITNVKDLAGRNGDDTLTGNAENNHLWGQGGNDTIYGGAGNDTLVAGEGNDSLYGDDGNDKLHNGLWQSSDGVSGGGTNLLDGGAGDDSYYFDGRQAGTTTIADASGNDTLYIFDYAGRDLNSAYVDTTDGSFVYKSNYGHTLKVGSDGAGGFVVDNFAVTSSGYNDLAAFTQEYNLITDVSSSIDDGHNWIVGGSSDDTIVIDSVVGITTSNLPRNFEYLVSANEGNDSITVSSALRGWIGGGSGDDVITANVGTQASFGGDSGNDTLTGADQDDLLYGGSGDDTLTGGAGNDTLDGSTGNDTYIFDHQSGFETISDSSGNDTIVFNLYDNYFGGTYLRVGDDFVFRTNDNSAGFTVTDHFAGNAIEKLTYTTSDSLNDWWYPSMDYQVRSGSEVMGASELVVGSDGNDDIVSFNINAVHDNIFAGAGDDQIAVTGGHMVWAGDGNDTLSLDTTAWISGDAGVDTAIFNTSADVKVNLASHAESAWGLDAQQYAIGTQTARTIYSFENVTTGTGADILQGDDNANTLEAGAGADQLFGGAGNDVLIAGDGADVLRGGAGADYLVGGSGGDIYRDVLSAFDGDYLSNVDELDVIKVQDETLTAANITIVENRFSHYTFTVDNGADPAVSFTVRALNGLDLSNGTASALSMATEQVSGVTSTIITLNEFTTAILGTDGNDDIEGTANNDHILSSSGDDVIHSFAGDDLIFTYDGSGDVVFDGVGDDYIQLHQGSEYYPDADSPDWSGGRYHASPGNDTIDFGSSEWAWIHYDGNNGNFDTDNGEAVINPTMGALINLTNSAQTLDGVVVASHTVRDSWGDTDTYLASASTIGGHFWGSSFDDHIVSDTDHWWAITKGDDSFVGGTNATSTIAASHVGDLQNLNWTLGESGQGTFNYRWVGDSADSTLVYENVRNVFGGSSNDAFTGNSENNQFYGFDGDDTLTGLAGNDELFGGKGNDTLLGGDGSDRLYNRQQHHDDTRNVDYGVDTMNGGAGDDVYYISGFNTTGSVTINDDSGNDTLYIEDTSGWDGGIFYISTTGNLIYETKSGHETIITKGSDGSFVVEKIGWYANGQSGVSSYSRISDIITDLTDIRDVNGTIAATQANDTIIIGRDEYRDDDGAYEVYANAGDDIVSIASTRGGWVLGGTGNDQITLVEQGLGKLLGEDGNDALTGASGGDYLAGGADNDTLYGNGGDDNLNGDSGNDALFGGDGNDQLKGHSGSNSLDGGAGNDNIVSAGELDILIGGAGDDAFDIATPEASSVWHSAYKARNVDMEGATGTQEVVSLGGKARYNHVLDGGDDYDALQLQDSDDAFFLDDIYSDFHAQAGSDPVARVVDLEAIYAGAGADIIDLTSTRFSLANNTEIHGEAGDDVLWAASGNDILHGGEGNDSIFASSGNDIVSGGLGADTFQFTATSDIDVLLDFVAANGDELHFYYQSGADTDMSDLSINAGVMTWDTGDNGNVVTIDMSATMDLDALTADLQNNIVFHEIV